MSEKTTIHTLILDRLTAFHKNEEGVAATEYIIIFSLISFFCTLAIFGSAYYVKGYRDFLLYWLSHPAV